MQLTGQASFTYPQKSLTINGRERFNNEFMNHKIWPNLKLESFTSIYLRNSGTPDNRHTMFRDALQHSIVMGQMDLDVQAYRPVVTYVNGEYWGIYNLREKLNADYLAQHHIVDQTNLDYLEYEFSEIPVVVEGDLEYHNEFMDFVEHNDLSLPENYAVIDSKMDIDEYINYQITQIYCDNINWPNTNVRWWRERTPGSKWRWILVDLDWGFGVDYPGFSSHFTHNALKLAVAAPGTFGEYFKWSGSLFRKLLENDEFKNEFIQRFASYLSTTFHPDRVVHIIDSLQTQIADEMVHHIDRWKGDPAVIHFKPPIPDIPTWNAAVEVMREFARNRTPEQQSHVINFFGLSGMVDLTLQVSGGGRIQVNQVPIPQGKTGTWFKDIPIMLEAIPMPGFRFAGWSGAVDGISPSVSWIPATDTTITAIFEAGDQDILPANIISDLTLSLENSPYIAATDIMIAPQATLTVEAGVEVLLPQNASLLINGRLVANGSESTPIRFGPNRDAGADTWGALCFQGSTGLSELQHVVLQGATHGPDAQKHPAAVSGYMADITLDYLTIEDAPFPIFTQYGNIIVRNSQLHTQRNSDLINIKRAATALVEGCDLHGNDAFDTDGIDYDQVDAGVIRNNRIYNFFGLNGDGIDLGEEANDILIEGNLIFNVKDKGISIGQGSTARIRNNIFVNCGRGIGIKDEGSYALVDRNTFYGNEYGVMSFEKNIGDGGGNLDVINCIFSRSVIEPTSKDALSSLNVSYSLSDTKRLDGSSNYLADPMLQNNFHLAGNSPAIDAGDPGGTPDPDGSRADLGAIPFEAENKFSIVINEILYNPSSGSEFVELCNVGNAPADLSGYSLSNAFEFAFPGGANINPGEHLIVAENAAAYENNGYQVFQWTNGSLPENIGKIELRDGDGEMIDEVLYLNREGWPDLAIGGGSSLELKDPGRENFHPANWRASFTMGGTPGIENTASTITGLFVNEVMAKNDSAMQDENGDYDDWIELYNGSQSFINIGGLLITDDESKNQWFRIRENAPDRTTIPPGGLLLLWADEEPEQGPLHLNFRLAAEGEKISLFQVIGPDTMLITQASYPAQTSNSSYARTMDGNDAWQFASVPTPGLKNATVGAFERGILLVNGLAFDQYPAVSEAYEQRTFWGQATVTFWDAFEEPPAAGYPATLPAPLGHGEVPLDTLLQFSSVIWVGDNSRGDLDAWRLTPILPYVKRGGNLLFMSRMGQDFIDDEMRDYLGIKWIENSRVTLRNCIAQRSGLAEIEVLEDQIVSAVFSTALAGESHLLFAETASFGEPRGTGVIRNPVNGGFYRRDGGKFAFISGRPFQYDFPDVRSTVEFILGGYFQEPGLPDAVADLATIITDFRLEQNYPNPFNPETTIRFDLPRAEVLSIKIYNIQGKVVRTLTSGEAWPAGRHSVVWDGKSEKGIAVGTGTYFYRLESVTYKAARKMLLLR
jgi:parallel beta-helix repeat protein